MRIDIIGAGSIGMLLAGRLAAADVTVRLVTRSEKQAGAVAETGLTVLESGCPGSRSNVKAISFARYTEHGRALADWILLTVKQKDLNDDLLEALRHRSSPESSVCCFQNGIGHLEKLVEAVGEGRLFAAVTTEGARRTGQSEVLHTGRGVTRLGSPGRNNPSGAEAKLHALALVLGQAGFSAELSNDIDKDIWSKLLINTVVNPLTAILFIPNGALLESGHTLHLMRQLYDEGVKVARALHIEVAEDLWDRLLHVCRSTAANRSSMLQDLEAGRLTEIEWLNGSLLRKAERLSLQLPVHQTVYDLIKTREQLISSRPHGGDEHARNQLGLSSSYS